MKVRVLPNAEAVNTAATDLLAAWLTAARTRKVMLAAGNSPLELYREVGRRKLSLGHLEIFALDEYVGVPLEHPRNCANTIRAAAIRPWNVPDGQFHTVSSVEADQPGNVLRHEQKIEAAGGLDVLVLGLGQNGHLGFNEPGSAENSGARVLDLDQISIEANRKWFGGEYAPAKGATVGMRTILAAGRIVIMAYGSHKTAATSAMLEGPRNDRCPASLLQGHPEVEVLLDETAASGLKRGQ